MRLGESRLPGLHVVEHEVAVPLDRDAPGGEQIRVYARELVAPRRRDADLPWLLYLTGGPGVPGPRPTGRSGWLGRALQDHRVLLLDYRGTGRSTPQTRQTLAGRSPADQAGRLACFRADAIVHDAEALRLEVTGDQPWSLLGQSYGGFVATTYLSVAPESLTRVMVTGGVPPVGRSPQEVYRATAARVAERWARFAERYPDDPARLDRVADRVAGGDVRLPSGDPLTVPRLQSLGMSLGYADGLERLHYLLETAFVDAHRDGSAAELSDDFLAAVESATSFATRPLYALLHESIYCDGGSSGWAAQQVAAGHAEASPDARPLLPTGEAIFPWMFEVDGALAPLREAAELLATHVWPALYDHDRLAKNDVPVAAAVFHDDMYVESSYSLDAAQRIGTTRTWVTNELGHDGLRTDARVIERLLDMTAGEA
jgi:pimeloyl-ACP methyl ester carboxylesterase